MKPRFQAILFPALAAGFTITITITSTHAAPLLPGKKIGVDYGLTPTTNWNNFTANGTKAAGTVLHLDGTVSDLLAMTVSNGQFFNNDGTNNWVGLQSNPASIAPNPKAPAEFVDSVTTDIGGNFSLGDASPFRLVVTGLNPYLAYKVDAVSTAGFTPTDAMTIIGDATYGPSAISRPLTVTQGLYHSFASVLPTTSGQLTFDTIDSGSGTNPVVNGILIEALAPTPAGLLDNDGDTMPNWWEVAYQFNPESNLDGGAADFDMDGVSNADEFTGGSDPRNPLSVPTIPTWTVDGDGSWNTPANWSTGSVPNGQNRSVRLASAALTTATGATITLDIPVTLGALETTGAKPFTLGTGNTLTFSATSPKAVVSTAADAGSSLELLGNVVLASPLEVTSGGTSAITIGGTLTETAGPHAITKNGTGDLVLAGDASGFAGAIALNAGRLVLNRPGAFTFDNALSGAGSLVHAGGGTLSLSFGNIHTGGTRVTNAGTLSLDNAAPIGSGALTLDNGTLHATGNISAANKSLNVGPGGATVEVDDGFVLTTGGSAAGSGTVMKTGPGTWRIEGGNSASIGMITIAAGILDLNRNDTWGSAGSSAQPLTIQSGGLVTNGSQINRGFNQIQTLALDGGELRVTGTARAIADGDLFKFEAYGIRNSLTVTGTTASSITNPGAITNAGINIGGHTDLGGGIGADLTVNVAEVTGSSAADLTVSAVIKNNYTNTASFVPLANGLVKTGDGTLELTALNRYTGTTSVEGGTLVLGQAFLANAADVKLTTGATLQLDFAGTDTIDELLIDGSPQTIGTWGRSGHPTAQHTTTLITGDGLLDVTTGPPPPVGYAGWASGFLPAFTNTAADFDFENDGLASGIEWVVGGDPTLNDAVSVAPTFNNTTDPNNFLFTFRRRDDAAADPKTTIIVQYGSDLAGWTPAQDGVSGVSINATTDLGGGFHQVTVAIPRTLAAGGKLFARLRVAVVTP